VLIGSRTASGAAGRGQYVATKSALNGMARSWATELARESDLAQQQLNHIGRL
jgi:NAD(P)-dependent dehydrogenase (short-subunit alcohol dehydrogenase family)